MNQQTVIHEQSGLNSFYSKIYSLVGVGVGISAVVSALMMTLFQETFMYILIQAPWVYYIAIAVELILVLVASRQSVKNNPMALPLFLTYSALNGFTLSFIIARYAQATVYKAFSHWSCDQKRLVWNGTSIYGGLDWYYHCFDCEHLLTKLWYGLCP